MKFAIFTFLALLFYGSHSSAGEFGFCNDLDEGVALKMKMPFCGKAKAPKINYLAPKACIVIDNSSGLISQCLMGNFTAASSATGETLAKLDKSYWLPTTFIVRHKATSPKEYEIGVISRVDPDVLPYQIVSVIERTSKYKCYFKGSYTVWSSTFNSADPIRTDAITPAKHCSPDCTSNPRNPGIINDPQAYVWNWGWPDLPPSEMCRSCNPDCAKDAQDAVKPNPKLVVVDSKTVCAYGSLNKFGRKFEYLSQCWACGYLQWAWGNPFWAEELRSAIPKFAFSSVPEGTLPDGPYKNSCDLCKFDGQKLWCRCDPGLHSICPVYSLLPRVEYEVDENTGSVTWKRPVQFKEGLVQ